MYSIILYIVYAVTIWPAAGQCFEKLNDKHVLCACHFILRFVPVPTSLRCTMSAN